MSRYRRCAQCGREFAVQRHDHRFCTRLCGGRYRRPPPTTPQMRRCPVCGLRFNRRRTRRLYCGRDCAVHAANSRRDRSKAAQMGSAS